jgi:site-specific DNA-methyltransferase (adenine-specific)
MPWEEYIKWLTSVWVECKRVLRKGGRLAINIATTTNRQDDNNKEYIRPIGGYIYSQMKQIGMLPFGEIVWSKQDAAGKKTAWGSFCACSFPIIRSTHEYIFVYSKEQFKLDGDPELSDLEPNEFEQWTFSTWFITPETSHPGGHPVPFPVELATRVIKLYPYRGDIVLDPFSGSGTTCYAAKLLNRRYIGIDIDSKYCAYAKERLGCCEDIFANETYIPRSIRLAKLNKADNRYQDIYKEEK